jgi:hypothetical protein
MGKKIDIPIDPSAPVKTKTPKAAISPMVLSADGSATVFVDVGFTDVATGIFTKTSVKSINLTKVEVADLMGIKLPINPVPFDAAARLTDYLENTDKL